MSLVLIADTLEGSVSLQRILDGHELVVVNTIKEGLAALQKESFDLIVVSLDFDESHMFEFIREIRHCSVNATKPIVCFCSRNTKFGRLMHESLELTARMLGAWMYLSEHSYKNAYQNPDAELRRVFDRCLSEEVRKEILEQRMDIQRQRAEIQRLRVLLAAQEWSPAQKEHLEELGHELELLLAQVKELQSSADIRRASIQSSRDLRDRVSDQVTRTEDGMTEMEKIQLAQESRQASDESELTRSEEIKQATHKEMADRYSD